jgi:hypothetical protein
MMKTAEIFSLKTNERIEFNPQENLLGKTVSRPWSPPRQSRVCVWTEGS